MPTKGRCQNDARQHTVLLSMAKAQAPKLGLVELQAMRSAPLRRSDAWTAPRGSVTEVFVRETDSALLRVRYMYFCQTPHALAGAADHKRWVEGASLPPLQDVQ